MKLAVLLITAIMVAGCATAPIEKARVPISEDANEEAPAPVAEDTVAEALAPTDKDAVEEARTPIAKEARDSEFPLTIDSAADRAIEQSPDAFLSQLLSTPQQDLIKFHHTFGRFIRNSYGLWGDKNPALLADCGSVHPDACSVQIIERVWQKLRSQQPTDELRKTDATNEAMDVIEVSIFPEKKSGMLRYVEFLNSQIAQSEYAGQFEVYAMCEDRHYRLNDFHDLQPMTLSGALGYIDAQYVADIVIESDRIVLRPSPFLNSPKCDELSG